MKVSPILKKLLIFSLLFWSFTGTIFAQYTPDSLGIDFEKRIFHMKDDYEGSVISTLIRRTPTHSSDCAILYVHGFNDYFFQEQMAFKFDSAGLNFYAVDLRKYGRSMLPSQYPFNVRSLNEYFADIDSAIQIIRKEGNREIILMGHSTGGLICSLYAEENRDHLDVNALILNSPFLDMNQSWMKENILIPIVAFIGRFFPNFKIPQGISTGYAESLLKEYHGEWNFNTNWKMPISPPLTAGWMRAIYMGQKKIRKGLHIPVPVLVMHSDKSIQGDDWTPDFQKGDAVLDVKDIEHYGKKLSSRITDVTIPNGLHDLILSSPTARELAYQNMFLFLTNNKLFPCQTR